MDNSEIEAIVMEEVSVVETTRNENKRKTKILYSVFIPLTIIAVLLLYIFSVPSGWYLIAVGLIAIPGIINSGMKVELTSRFKNGLIIPVLARLRPDISYQPGSFIAQETFNESNLFDKPNKYKGEDLFNGKHHKTTFSFSEIHAQKKKKSGKNTTYVTIFKGVFMVADFNKHIKNETYVFTSGGKWFSRFKRVKLENPEFEDNFKVYSDNALEARYILTPSLMEKIIELEKTFNAKLFMSFIGSNVYIALQNSNNFFEPNLDQEVNQEMVQDIVGEIDACVEIIDELDLNTRIWTKQ